MMKMSKIPKAQKVDRKLNITVFKNNIEEKKLIFSFEPLERTEYFNLDGTCNNWASDLFEMLKQVSQVNVKDLISNKFPTYRVHDHENAKPPSELPVDVALKDCYQIRISQSKGGIHGVFVDNIFYVIWLDPLHNLYPDDRFGGLRKIKPPSTCCREREEEIVELKEKISSLEADIQVYEKLLEECE